MIIDMHVHIGDFRLSADEPREPLTWENLIARLDDEGIAMAAFLPVYNASPEGAPGGVCLLDERMSVRDQVLVGYLFRRCCRADAAAPLPAEAARRRATHANGL